MTVYRASGYGGIAWEIVRSQKIRDEDFEWSGIEEDDPDHVIAVMVGDDREFPFDISDLEEITEDEYCSECGQIGCTANAY